jgi:hypothetical protein
MSKVTLNQLRVRSDPLVKKLIQRDEIKSTKLIIFKNLP